MTTHSKSASATFAAGPTSLGMAAPATLVLLFLLAGTALATPSANTTPRREPGGADANGRQGLAMREGLAALERGDWSAAVDAFERAAALPDAPPEALRYLGIARWRAGDLSGAGEALTDAAEAAPEDPQPWLLLGLVRFERRQMAQAREALGRALELDAQNPVVHLAIARLRINLVQFEQAGEALDRVAELDPDNPGLRTARGLLLYRSGDLAGSRRELEAALAANPVDREALFHAANVALQLGDYAAAEARARALLDEDPSHARAQYVLSVSLQAQGRAEEAALHRRSFASQMAESSATPVQGAMAGQPTTPLVSAWRLLRDGEAARLRGARKEARELARMAMSIEPTAEAAAQRLLALISYDEGDYADAEARLRTLWATEKTASLAHDLVLALLQQGQPVEARAVLATVPDFVERDTDLAYLQAFAVLQSGDAEAAVFWANWVIERAPDFAQAWLVLARAHEARGNTEEAAVARRRYEELRRRQ